jgi:hypothetical protein
VALRRALPLALALALGPALLGAARGLALLLARVLELDGLRDRGLIGGAVLIAELSLIIISHVPSCH